MELRTVDENNIEEYSHIVDMDVAENIGRVFYHGLAGHDPYDDSILSLLIWELKGKDSDENPESELKLIYSIDPSYISPLMDGYGSEAADDCAKLPLAKKPAPSYVGSLGILNNTEFYQGLMNILFRSLSVPPP